MLIADWTGKAYGKNQMPGVSNRGGKGAYYKKREYRDFCEELSWTFVKARLTATPSQVRPLAGIVLTTVELWISEMRDVDSLEAAINDCIQAAGIVRNDRQIRGVFKIAHNRPRGEPDRIRVTVGQPHEAEYWEAVDTIIKTGRDAWSATSSVSSSTS